MKLWDGDGRYERGCYRLSSGFREPTTTMALGTMNPPCGVVEWLPPSWHDSPSENPVRMDG
uniref:Uncharacterized protein n=1 Tax=Oryza sativa subsp. japonica TaxID=39947 RepID=Q654D2_ORYSJ|nr:hypothetical protein [Oryza sativa Japonica Group]